MSEFETFDKTSLELKKDNLKSWAIDSLVAEVFLTPSGLKLLGYLEKITIQQASFSPGMKELSMAAFREGQNDIVRQLIESLKRHQGSGGIVRKVRQALNQLLNKTNF